MLFNIVLQRSRSHSRNSFECRKHLGFFDDMVMEDPISPGSYEELEVFDILARDVQGLEIYSVKASKHTIVCEGHLVGDVVGWMIILPSS